MRLTEMMGRDPEQRSAHHRRRPDRWDPALALADPQAEDPVLLFHLFTGTLDQGVVVFDWSARRSRPGPRAQGAGSGALRGMAGLAPTSIELKNLTWRDASDARTQGEAGGSGLSTWTCSPSRPTGATNVAGQTTPVRSDSAT
jgi:hypothetical protein